MKQNSLQKGRAASIPAGALFGAMCAMIWTLLASGILSWLVHTEKMAEQNIGYGSMVILLTASVLGATISFAKVKRQRAVACLSAGGIYLLILLAINALFFGGQYTDVGVTATLVIGGSGVAIFLGMERGKRKRGVGRKIRI